MYKNLKYEGAPKMKIKTGHYCPVILPLYQLHLNL